jgi:hypothetical protein
MESGRSLIHYVDKYLMHWILIVSLLNFCAVFGNILGTKVRLYCYLHGMQLYFRCQHWFVAVACAKYRNTHYG